MRMSRRAKRMERHHRRKKGTVGFNLISLMDIFTILVFFLLVNSSDVQEVPSTKAVQLPESLAEQKPRETVVVMVTSDAVLVQGEAVATLAAVQRTAGPELAALKTALQRLAGRTVMGGEDPAGAAREVTILGDKAIPFTVLKKIMTTCTRAGYERISLAVLQRSATQGAAS